MNPLPVPSPEAEPRPAMIRRLFDLRRRMSWKQAFTALKYPNYRVWFWGQMFSLFGSWMQTTAQGFLIFELTKSPTYLGLVGFSMGLPTWFFMLYAGVIADRVSRRSLIVITQTAMMLLAFLLAALTFLRLVQPWHILLIALLLGVANAFEAPARQAFVLEMVDLPDLTNAIALNSAMFNTATAVGPAAAGIVYALFGPGWCFTVNAVTFLPVIVALRLMKLAPFSPRPDRNHTLTDLKEGLKYVTGHPLIRTTIVLVGVVTLFGISYVVLIPAWAVNVLHGGAATNGFLIAARGLGALAGALVIASLGRFAFKGRLLTIGSIAMPALLIVFAFARWVPVSLVLLFAAGLMQIFFYNLCNALIQTSSPNELRGRIMGVYTFVFFGLLPVGALAIGTVAGRLGSPAAVTISASLAFLAAVLVRFAAPRLWAHD